MGKVQDYLEKKRIEKEGYPTMWVVHSTREGVKEPIERQVIHSVYGSQNIKYVLKTKEYPFEITLKHGNTSDIDEGYGSGFGDLWMWTYFTSLSKKEGDEWYEEETKRVMLKYLPKQKKTEKIFVYDESIEDDFKFKLFVELDYIDYLQFRLKLLETGYVEGYYIENQHGGVDKIDRFGCSGQYNDFKCINEILCKIIHLQCDLRKKEYELEQKQKENDSTEKN